MSLRAFFSLRFVLWAIAGIGFCTGLALMIIAKNTQSDTHKLKLEAATMQREIDAQQRLSGTPVTLTSLLTSTEIAPQVSQESGKTVLRFTGAPANRVMQSIADISRAPNLRVSSVALAFPAPGIAAGTVEVVSP